MSFAPENTLFITGDGSIRGLFYTVEFNTRFEFSAAGERPDGWDEFDSLVWVADGTSRFARVLKTVAYVVVDENADGTPVVEKWAIKGHTLYEAPAK